MGTISDRLKAMFSGGKEPKIEEDLKHLGISVITDKKFSERQLEIQAILDLIEIEIDKAEPEDYIEDIHKKLNAVNRGVVSLAAPYYKSLDNTKYSTLMEGWSLWAKLALSWVQTVRGRILTVKEEMEAQEMEISKPLLEKALINTWIIIKRLEAVLDYHVYQDAQLILMRSYGKDEVGHGIAVAIQSFGTSLNPRNPAPPTLGERNER